MKSKSNSEGCYRAIISCSEYEGIVWCLCAVSAHRRSEVWRGEKVFVLDHSVGGVVGELLYLLSDVPQKYIDLPTSYHHDGERRDTCEVHRHGYSRSEGMSADVFRSEAEFLFAKCSDH